MSDNSFITSLVGFYKDLIGSTSDAIKKLIVIEEEYPDDYSLWISIQDEPSKILEFYDEIDDESKNKIFELYFRVNIIAKKMAVLYELPIDKKRDLIKEIDEFKEYFEGFFKDKNNSE